MGYLPDIPRILTSAGLLTAALVVGGSLSPMADTPTASAAPSGNIVTFGGSFTSNPDQVRNTFRGAGGELGEWARDYPATAGCLQAPNNWPRKLAHATGRHVDDWSCTAQTSGSLVGRVDHAIRSGAVHNDSTVVISTGLNDFGSFGAVDNQNLALFDPPAVARDFTANMRTVADRIRSHAPDAHIVMTGSLPTVDRANTTFCALNVVPDFPLGAPVPVLRDVENWNRDNQRSAAAEMGADFVEIMDCARGHDTCAPDQARYVAGIIDTTTPDYNMAFHPSDAGSQYVANTVAGRL
ncbi:MAG: GDSL-type esterase/lipase family protein [Corynebacterium sp.]|uniref:GDSL-type esterase/lipase family protein n=1 Tax=Corynebacterium TaxID=1716 RepID=UPI0026488B5B|nr:GDSL-type esterase/lipase family protein [Corynebacterium sp.]MDN5723091.1 GDSL-type esterase/lipase family protein [Corynebacterium sp.]MDN6282391.1 GDSL-type esterase/lipase family protein [Corynebacterium sp.]MDN6306668.1 GDSL-type esterase/lipase family protein [Corynebacterium sp.]MDN6352221.1 GDSL-type esterase/lipase family protein [Corynebacterium sp.]MDN6366987.1 GDSL-type esterase/lipase family protein [Corynebacterium sp.]